MRRYHSVAAVLTVAIMTSVVAYGAVPGFTEDFNSGMGGFGGGSTYALIPSGGVGGAADGYLEVSTTFVAKLGARSTANDLTGDLSGSGVTGFSFWLNDVGQDDPLEIHVGVGSAFTNFWISTAGFGPPENSWGQFSVDLTDESGWVQIIGSGTFASALQNSDRLLFRHDGEPLGQFPPSIQGDFGLDRITVLPEPASLALLALGGAVVVRRRRR
ncbi:MAG: PEP-CTERM sorting domain-containing protein [bacterium]|nr:PEP-CTERM sorting domain-containing protein [bacterium]